ncbi:choice-of-anchor B family protein [Marinoscillum furvescens]|uniref:Choice-of-anchor B domain-containing protein n=1 Tax=Marinoscillum furvescens DSM 4134 TaxID=1122208 RepID=A0A3D9L1Y0_MARFU|nr:choice-of-anchor B family protein [Marinoscillum furvescens]RED96166.1 choice-of-anchor B domain-containing protein [Marinoscillum furvescens DSM 4134]
MKALFIGFALATALMTAAQTPCENGLAGEYPCNQIDLLAHLFPSDLKATEHNGFYLNDLWGWTDPDTNAEYVILGLKDGVAFIEVTDPLNPVIIGKLPEPTTVAQRTAHVMHGEKSTWRDIKVANNYAYIVSDLNADHGMQVIDLTRLKNETPAVDNILEADGWYRGLGSSHNVVTNEQTNYVIAVGLRNTANSCSGGLHIIDVSDPINPQFEACFSADGYTHDAQYVIYEGPDNRYKGQEIVFASNENTLTIVDISDKSDLKMIGRETYDQVRYTHQGWLSEDHRFFIINDELDEREYGHTPRTLIWNVEDLENPKLIGNYYHNAVAIDHNLYTHDSLVYAANYKSGLRVLDMNEIAQGKLREVAHFDTYPELDEISFGGAWSSYPYFASGTIAVSDMNNGLFLLRLSPKEDPIASHPKDSTICEGGTARFSIQTAGDGLSYQWQKFNGKRYTDIADDVTTSGAQTASISFPANRFNEGTPFRCRVSTATDTYYSFEASYTLSGSFPVANYTYESGANGTISFTNQSEHATAYLWSFGDGETSQERSPVHEYASSGAYDVALIAMNDCGGDTLTLRTAVITSIGHANEIHIFPNPVKDQFQMQLPNASMVRIMNLAGQVLYRSTRESGITTVDISHLPSGQYFVWVTTGDTHIRQKFLKP